MLPFFLILITSLAKPAAFPAPVFPEVAPPVMPGEGQGLLALPAGSSLQGCAPASGGLASHWALPCGAVAAPTQGASFAGFPGFAGRSSAAQPGTDLGQGGFLHLDLLRQAHFGAGPEVSWVTPERPHEDLLQQRQVTPGVGVWYSPLPSLLFVGLSANTQVSTLGETWFVNALSSEARCGLSL